MDGKRLTLSANSWPARYVTHESSQVFDYTHTTATIPPDISLQYVNPPTHSNLLSCIVQAELNTIIEKISKCIALSLRCDGSIDRSQIDKIYVLGKIVNPKGELELLFLGVGEQKKQGAAGLLDAVLSAIEDNFNRETLITVLKKMSSVCTDGARINTGEGSGLWMRLEKEMLDVGSTIPLVKLWCGAHRSDVAWGDLTPTTNRLIAQLSPEVKALKKILDILSSLSSHFHSSAVRTTELKEIAQQHGLRILSMPKLFTVRWTEFTYNLIRAILTSWHATVLFLEKNKRTCASSNGFYKYLANLNFLKMVAFLGDVLRLFKRMQKKMQGDSLTLIKMSQDIAATKLSLESLKQGPMLGGYEYKLERSLSFNQTENKWFMKGIKLEEGIIFRSVESIENFRTEVVDNLIEALDDRFKVENDQLISAIQPFVELKASAAQIEKVHELIAKDLDASSLAMQYMDLSAAHHLKELSFTELVKFVSSPEQRKYYEEISTAFGRILAATPHSADVERCVSANNLLKTALRNSFKIENENNYLFIHFNLPSLEDWCPKKAAAKWVKMAERRQRNVTPSTGKATVQPYFNGIFRQVENEKEEEDDSDMTKFQF